MSKRFKNYYLPWKAAVLSTCVEFHLYPLQSHIALHPAAIAPLDIHSRTHCLLNTGLPEPHQNITSFVSALIVSFKRSRLQTRVDETYGVYIYTDLQSHLSCIFSSKENHSCTILEETQKKIVNGNWKSSTVYTVNRSTNLSFELTQRMLILISLLQSINSPRNKETKTSRNYDNNNTFLSECPESHIRATEYTKDLWRRTHPQFCTM